MSVRLVPLILASVLVPAFIAASGLGPAPALDAAQGPQASPATESDAVRAGIRHFERAFYDHAPHKRDREAAMEFDLAIAAFERELKARPSSLRAHAYLGRTYSVRKEFRKAAAHYDRVMELDPLDVDACVLAALAYAEDGQILEARARLTAARARTSDPAVLARLSEYSSKLDSVR